MSLLPKNLRYLRRKRSERQADIAIRVKKKQNTIGNWENGISEPNIRELSILSHYFDVSLEELISADLEKMDLIFHAASKEGSILSKLGTVSQYDFNNVVNSVANESGQDQFWIIARELRKINEKLDMIWQNLGAFSSDQANFINQIRDSSSSGPSL